LRDDRPSHGRDVRALRDELTACRRANAMASLYNRVSVTPCCPKRIRFDYFGSTSRSPKLVCDLLRLTDTQILTRCDMTLHHEKGEPTAYTMDGAVDFSLNQITGTTLVKIEKSGLWMRLLVNEMGHGKPVSQRSLDRFFA
jgi:hypothetical protein